MYLLTSAFIGKHFCNTIMHKEESFSTSVKLFASFSLDTQLSFHQVGEVVTNFWVVRPAFFFVIEPGCFPVIDGIPAGTWVKERNGKMNWNVSNVHAPCAVCNDVRIFALLSLYQYRRQCSET